MEISSTKMEWEQYSGINIDNAMNTKSIMIQLKFEYGVRDIKENSVDCSYTL